MKFRDPKTGEVFEELSQSECYFDGPCPTCPLSKRNNRFNMGCRDLIRHHPAEAARLMGYEVIESEEESQDGVQICEEVKAKVKEVNMEKQDKPRLAEVLGVEVGEPFWFGAIQYFINFNGQCHDLRREVDNSIPGSEVLAKMIEHPESIIRAPRLTEAERAIMRAIGAQWVSRDGNSANRVELWSEKPGKTGLCSYAWDEEIFLARANCKLFPSVRPGDCICVEEAQHDD